MEADQEKIQEIISDPMGEKKVTHGPRGRGISRPTSQSSLRSEISSPSPGSSMFCSSILTSEEKAQIWLKSQSNKAKHDIESNKGNSQQNTQTSSPNHNNNNNKRNLSGSHNSSGTSPSTQRNTKKGSGK